MRLLLDTNIYVYMVSDMDSKNSRSIVSKGYNS